MSPLYILALFVIIVVVIPGIAHQRRMTIQPPLCPTCHRRHDGPGTCAPDLAPMQETQPKENQ